MKKTDLFKERRNFFSKLFITGAGSLTLLSLSGCGSSSGSDSAAVQLTDEQKDELFFIYQEEKLARDVYITLGNEYPDENTFAYIQLSEQRHIDSVEQLCIKYNVDISAVNEDVIGEFVLPELQELYEQLVAAGMVSLPAALQVGIDIEILDITDLEERAVGMPSDVVRVFENLKEGSQNHLEAFTYALSKVT